MIERIKKMFHFPFSLLPFSDISAGTRHSSPSAGVEYRYRSTPGVGHRQMLHGYSKGG